MINELPISQIVRQPRGIVKINGVRTDGWIEWTVDNNKFYQADTFSVALAESALPFDLSLFSSSKAITVELFAGFPANPDKYTEAELTSWIFGKVDDLRYVPSTGLIELTGRDLTSQLIDSKTTNKYQNLTASQIVEQVAQAHGLNPVVTPTTTKSGRYYEIDKVRLQHERSEWDLLTYLAHEESFHVYVQGKNLHFEPQVDPNSDPYVLQWDKPTDSRAYANFNGKSLSFSRNLTLAKDVIVYVRSWNQKMAKGFTVKAQATHNKNTVLAGAAQPFGDAQVYSFTVPNKTREEALQIAQARLREITAHEVNLDAEMPADNVLTTRNIIKVVGTGSAFDQTYYPDSIVRTMSVQGGYNMRVHAKNHSPESTVIV